MKPSLFCTHTALFLCLCAAAASAQPGDSQVITDVVTNKTGLIEAKCTEGKKGEQYWHSGDQAWYWDRGVVIRRKASISGAPNAVVIVKGLARYNVLGGKYTFKKFLTTSNEYEGIPAPSSDELSAFVNANLKKVFSGREHSITEVSSVAQNAEKGWTWHEATRFSVQFNIVYKEVVSYTEVADKQGTFDIMFYRKDINSAPHNLLSVEVSSQENGRKKYSEKEIQGMKSLANQ
jgi:hypothetical protein